MGPAAWTVCKAFLQKCDPKKRESLVRHLPMAEKNHLAEFPITYGDPSQGFESLSARLNRVHASWFSPFLRSLTENQIRLHLACLDDDQAQFLKNQLGLSNHLPELTPLGRSFIEERLWKALLNGNGPPMPVVCLPDSPLNPLIDLSESDLNRLIEDLGLHDLATELRFIIETSKLKNILRVLDERQQRLLKRLAHEKEAVTFKRMSLDQWDGNEDQLKAMIKQRGLNRLAKALHGQNNPDLYWYISHRLDMESASVLKKFYTPLDHPRAEEFLAQQIGSLAATLQHRPTP